MRRLAELPAERAAGLRVIFTDIDGTLTDDRGRIPSSIFAAMEEAVGDGLAVVPVTGRPAGWCDMIVRTWPVHGVIGENGGLRFRRDGERILRDFEQGEAERSANQLRLLALGAEVLRRHPGAALASDQCYREFDIAIDFAEDVAALPWTKSTR